MRGRPANTRVVYERNYARFRAFINAAIHRVRLKIERAANYDRRYPLWLFLQITDMMGEFSQTVKRFGTVRGRWCGPSHAAYAGSSEWRNN